MSKEYLYLAAGVLIGASAAYVITKQVLDKKYDEIMTEEIKHVKAHYDSKRVKKSSPEHKEPDTNAELKTVIDDLGYAEDELEESIEALRKKAENGWQVPEDISESKVKVEMSFTPSPRDPDKPYVINVEEFTEVFDDYDKLSVTYYEGDDVMADERDSVIPDPDNLVGAEALTRFGDGSDDENIVYVRNEKLESDFEIVRDVRSYASVVLGLEEDSATEPGKFREYED